MGRAGKQWREGEEIQRLQQRSDKKRERKRTEAADPRAPRGRICKDQHYVVDRERKMKLFKGAGLSKLDEMLAHSV